MGQALDDADDHARGQTWVFGATRWVGRQRPRDDLHEGSFLGVELLPYDLRQACLLEQRRFRGSRRLSFVCTEDI